MTPELDRGEDTNAAATDGGFDAKGLLPWQGTMFFWIKIMDIAREATVMGNFREIIMVRKSGG